MDIRLVTTSFNDEVHGTFNDKKTGCGINLLKSENVTRFHRGGIMTDLGELTCEKCKAKIAKEMIRSDQKEMKALLKEEKLRQKKGIEDESIVPLGNTVAKPTRAKPAEPAQKPVTVKPTPVKQASAASSPAPRNIPGTGVAMDNDLAQFAIEKPQEEKTAAQQADDFLSQFAVPAPAAETEPEPVPIPEAPAPVPAPAPAPAASAPVDDFLAQFAVPSAAPAPSAPEPTPAPAPAPAAPPVIDDVSAALAAMQTNVPQRQPEPAPAPVQAAPAPTPAPAVPDDDILNMFAIDKSAPTQEAVPAGIPEAADENIIDIPQETAPAPAAEDANHVSEWDLIANQLFGIEGAQGQAAPQTAEPVIADVPAAQEAAIAPAQYQANAPIIDDISAAISSVQQNIPSAAPVQQPAAIAPAQYQANAPIIDDISAAMAAAEQNVPKPAAPVQEAAPVIDDISAAMAAVSQNVPKPAAPAPAPVQEEVPVIDDISAAMNAVQQNAPKPVPVQAAPVRTAAPKKIVPKRPAPAVQAAPPDPSQVISVPQITGYDSANQPIYTYIQMQITGYDDNGQPVLVPIPGQELPQFTPSTDKNTRLRDAVRAAQEVPTSSREMTPGQRIAAAAAAKGDPVTANVSQIATNPHSRSTSQAFINAISESKEYANQSLTDTQGLQQRTRVIGSIEDVLSQLGDNSLKQKKEEAARAAQVNVPQFEEYKAPTRSNSSYSSSSAPKRPAPKPSMPDRPLTKSELKAMKKQEKIDAKFRKDMAKRGF